MRNRTFSVILVIQVLLKTVFSDLIHDLKTETRRHHAMCKAEVSYKK